MQVWLRLLARLTEPTTIGGIGAVLHGLSIKDPSLITGGIAGILFPDRTALPGLEGRLQ